MRQHPFMQLALYVVDWFSILSVIVLVVIFALTGDMLPLPHIEKPHSEGFVDTYGMRPILLVMFLAAVACDALIVLFARFPNLYRYPVHLTPANIEAQYFLAKIMLSMAMCIVSIYFSILMVEIYRMRIHVGDAYFLYLTNMALASFGIDWLIYYLGARLYR